MIIVDYYSFLIYKKVFSFNGNLNNKNGLLLLSQCSVWILQPILVECSVFQQSLSLKGRAPSYILRKNYSIKNSNPLASDGLNSLSLGIKLYINAYEDRVSILKENKEKSGIYLWKNKQNGNIYIGSSANLRLRISNYFSISYLEKTIKNNKSKISRAILKYGFSEFSLEILEYCEISELIIREQYYIDLFKPEYNILKKAGSSLGFKHSEETKAKFKTRELTPEQEARRLELLKIHNSSEKMKEHLKSLHIIQSQKVEVLDTFNNETKIYPSIGEAALSIGIHKSTIGKAFGSQKEKGASRFIKKRYMISLI